MPAKKDHSAPKPATGRGMARSPARLATLLRLRRAGAYKQIFRSLTMSAKGIAPEADLLRGPVLSSRLAKLAQLFVEWTSQRPLQIIVAFAILTFASGLYVVRHFSINTDVNALISADLPWRQRELAYEAAFPQSTQGILAVVEAPTPELASAAATALASALGTRWTFPLGRGARRGKVF